MAHIKTYCRIKPSSTAYQDLKVIDNNIVIRLSDISPDLTKVRPKSAVNYQFLFGHVFIPTTSQTEIFETVASSIIQG